MATVNKHYLREEFDAFKAEFERLTAAGKMAAESRALFQALLMLFEVLMAVFMERSTTKGKENSSLPSSQTPKDDDTATQPGANGKGKSQNDALSGNTRTVETVQIAPVTQCRTCGEDLSRTPCQGHERRTRIDIIFEKVAIEAIGVIPRYGGVVIHDCWASYLAYDHCGHGLCGSHLLRELVFVIDANGYAWATNMKRLLQETCAKVSKRKRKKLTKTEYTNLQKRFRNILTRGEKELPPIPPRQNGKRGRIAKSDAHNLWERMKQYEEAVLLFAKASHVSFTNNRAERDLRMSKVKQKASGCFRTSRYAEAYCRISSYLQTMANQGYNPLVAIQMALSGQIYAETGE